MRKQPSLLVLSVLCAGCAGARAQAIECDFNRPALVARLAIHPLARLERTGCFGWCPEYAVEIDIDGVVTYVGRNNVMTAGPASGQVSADQLRLLRQAVALARHTEMPHTKCACGCVADAPDVNLTTWESGVPTTVTYDVGCARLPAAIRSLEADIDEVVEIERWIGTRAAREACFEKEKDCSSLVGVPEPAP